MTSVVLTKYIFLNIFYLLECLIHVHCSVFFSFSHPVHILQLSLPFLQFPHQNLSNIIYSMSTISQGAIIKLF